MGAIFELTKAQKRAVAKLIVMFSIISSIFSYTIGYLKKDSISYNKIIKAAERVEKHQDYIDYTVEYSINKQIEKSYTDIADLKQSDVLYLKNIINSGIVENEIIINRYKDVEIIYENYKNLKGVR